jgi:hypothetical protein
MLNCMNCTSNTPTLTANQNDFFANQLELETASYFDGNIGKQTWVNRKDSQARSYVYNYDASSRLKSAIYSGVGAENYSLSNINYDQNGNILNLLRKGKNGSNFSDIDNLTYTYQGNRLTGINDAVSGNENVGDFKESPSGGAGAYTYWPDGSLKSDANRGISQIEYDSFLQRVKQVNFNNGNWLRFYYDGNGALLKRENAQNEIWEYANRAIYKNVGNGQPQLYQIATDEGRILPKSGGGFENEFEYRDIWGNLRLTFKEGEGAAVNGVYPAPVITQTDDFDMLGFGLGTSQNGSNNFRFQKQERVFDYGLNWDLFKFRYSDSQIGRFHQIDPLASDYPHNSTYALQENKFGRGVELEGLELGPFPVIAIPALVEGLVALTEAAVYTGVILGVRQNSGGADPYNSVLSTAMSTSRPGELTSMLNSSSKPSASANSSNSTAQTNSDAQTKLPPNPDGKKGGKAHQETNKREADRMEKEGKVVQSEVKIDTPGGKKSKRFVDQTGTDPTTGSKEMVQVGKQNKNGTPVKRERDAMDDIEKATGQRPTFVPYNPK